MSHRIGSWRVLIADDLPSSRHYLAGLLRGQEWDIVEAHSRKEAAQWIKSRSVDLAILEARLLEDSNMSKLLERLHESPLPLVVYSSSDSSPSEESAPVGRQSAARQGAGRPGVATLNRPFSRAELFDAVQRACKSPSDPPTRVSKMDLEQKRQLSQKMELLGRLTAGVVHDFNNLLTVILGAGSMLQERTPADSPLRNLSDQVCQAAQKGASLTAQLLAFSRHQPIKPKIINLNESLHNLEPLLRQLVGKRVTLSFNCAQELHSILADANQIDQVIMNLALNARDAMAYGGQLIIETANVVINDSTPRAFSHVPHGNYVCLNVRDNGSGMSEDTLTHLFEPFFTTKKEGQGTGLGLATVQSILQRSGGHVAVTSELGLGSTFSILFPLADSETASAD